MRTLSILFLIILVMGACENDDSFGRFVPQDSPAFILESDVESINTGGEVNFLIRVVDAPGLIDTVSITATNDLGELTLDQASLDAARGNTEGEIRFSWTAPEKSVGDVSVSVTLFDQQSYLVNALSVTPQSKSFNVATNIEVNYSFDAATFTVSLSDDELISGDSTELTIDITDVPGNGIDTVIAASSAGSVVLDEASLADAIGESSAVVTGWLYPGDVSETGAVTVDVTVVDEAQARPASGSGTVLVICPSAEDISGTYTAISNGALGDGTAFQALQATVVITRLNDGQFEIDDMSFGVYPDLYGEEAPAGTLNICSDAISDNGDEDQFGDPFTISGVLANPDVINGTIDISWSNTFGDGGTVQLIRN